MRIFMLAMQILILASTSPMLSMDQSKQLTLERRHLDLKKVQGKLNQVGKKFVHHHGTEGEQKLRQEAEQLHQKKEQLQSELAGRISSSVPVIAKISIQEKVETLNNFFEIPIYPPVPAPLEDESDKTSQGSSPKIEIIISSEEENDECQFTPDDKVSKQETLETQKQLFNSIVTNGSPVMQAQSKLCKKEKMQEKQEQQIAENADDELIFEFDEDIARKAKAKKELAKRTSPVTPLHVARLYTKARFASVPLANSL